MSILSRFLRHDEPAAAQPVELLLREHHIPYELHHHPPAYSAQRLAACEHVPGKLVAKVVIAFADGRMLMLVLPATANLNLMKLAEAVETEDVRVARENEFAAVFADCEVGAMPPFGNLYDLPVLVDRSLAADEEILFPAGTHTETVRMRYADFADIVHPRVADLASSSPCLPYR
jgi:Ala-tRNA(Pro) deacylase